MLNFWNYWNRAIKYWRAVSLPTEALTQFLFSSRYSFLKSEFSIAQRADNLLPEYPLVLFWFQKLFLLRFDYTDYYNPVNTILFLCFSHFHFAVKIFRENDKFVTSVFRKETFSGVYTNFISFIPLEYKFGLVHTLLNRCFNLSSDFFKFHHEVDKLRKILSKNAYPQKFIEKCIQKFLNNVYSKATNS